MRCAQCWKNVGSDWVQWRQRHARRYGETSSEAIDVKAVVLCAPPRVCAQEFAQDEVTRTKAMLARKFEEPF